MRLRSMKDSAFLRQKNEYRLLKYFALPNSKADARLGVLVAELLKIQCFRESTPCRRVLWLRPRRSWDHPASCSLDTGSPTLGVKQKELLRLKIIWTIGWCKTGLPELKKRMEENNTLPAPTIVNVCIPASCWANIPYRINAHLIHPPTNRRQLCIAQCILTSYFPLHCNAPS
jgi:hypothetical protein